MVSILHFVVQGTVFSKRNLARSRVNYEFIDICCISGIFVGNQAVHEITTIRILAVIIICRDGSDLRTLKRIFINSELVIVIKARLFIFILNLDGNDSRIRKILKLTADCLSVFFTVIGYNHHDFVGILHFVVENAIAIRRNSNYTVSINREELGNFFRCIRNIFNRVSKFRPFIFIGSYNLINHGALLRIFNDSKFLIFN